MSACDDVGLLLCFGRPLDAAAAAHLASCPACRATEADARALAVALAADAAVAPPPGLAARVLHAAAPVLAVHARRAARPDWRAVWRAVGAALVPLPVLVYLDVLLVRGAYRVVTLALPPALGLYVVGSYAVVIAALLALAYAAAPILAARQAAPAAGGLHA